MHDDKASPPPEHRAVSPSAAPEADPTAALLIIGAEVLSGKVADANAPYLIRALRARGVELVEIRTIGDSIDTIASAITALRQQATHVFTTGGIGPTHDDVTMAGVARAFGRQLERHPDLVAALTARYGDRQNDAAFKMTEVPSGARVSLPEGGFVPIVQVENVTILPGVPALMRMCFDRAATDIGGRPFTSYALLLDLPESRVAALLTRIQAENPSVAIGSYPRFDDAAHRLKITFDGRDEPTVAAARDALERELPPDVWTRAN